MQKLYAYNIRKFHYIKIMKRKIEDTKRAIAEAAQCDNELLRAFMVSELTLRLASLEKEES